MASFDYHTAKLAEKEQITIPVSIRRLPGLKDVDKEIGVQNEQEVVSLVKKSLF